MQRKARGIKLDGSVYDCLFDPATGENHVVKKGATLDDTLKLFPEYVPQYAHQAKRLASAMRDIEGDVSKTCYNLWYFLVHYVAYEPDKPGIEQVRSTDRLWSDKLGDCDCFAFTISCVLYLLKIKHTLRITQYNDKDGFQHIYVIVPHKGKEIIVDACLERFNIEVPYINKTEVEMDLQFLNGLDPESFARNGGSVDADELLANGFTLEDLGSVKTFFNKAKQTVKNAAQKTKATGQKVKTAVKKSVHVINRVNPATTALRLGVLAAMRLNMFGVAGNLRYAYLSDEEAQKRGLNMKRFTRFKKVREKLEKIFFSAGGKPENLKEAILTGKGNQNREVALSGYGVSNGSYQRTSSLKEIIGDDIYNDEMQPLQVNGLGTLGVVTEAAVAAASGILASLAAILKNIGDLKKGGDPGPDQALDEMTDGSSGDQSAPDGTAPVDNSDQPPADSGDDSSGANERDSSTSTDSTTTDSTDSGDGSQAPPQTPPSTDAGAGGAKSWTDKLKDFYNQYKTPIWIVGGVVVTVGGALLVKKFMGRSSKKGKESGGSLSGVPKKGKRKYAGSKTLRKLKMKPLV